VLQRSAVTRPAAIALAIVIAAVAVIRAPSVRVDILNEDEALYATTAASMADGEPPYRAGVESKPPGIFYIYEAGFALVGRYDMRALHALTMLWVLGTALLVGAIARRAVKRDKGRAFDVGVLASLLYAGFTIVQEPAVLATQCELMYSLPLAGAAYLILRGLDSRGARAMLALVAAGVLCGAGTLIKPTAVSLPVAAAGWLVLRRKLFGGPDPWLRDVARAALIWLGLALAWLAAAAYFSHLGVWDDLIYWAFRWTLGTYIPTGSSHSPWLTRFLAGFVVWAVLTTALWIAAAFAIRDARVRREPGAQVVWLLVAWTAAATALTFLGGRFFDHYFPAPVTPLAALAAIGAWSLRDRVRWRRGLAVGALVPVVACWLGAWQFATTMRWLGDDRKPYDEIAAYIDEHTEPTDRVFVWGYYPLIYVAADRLAATRFVGCHYLTGYAAIGLSQDLPPAIEDKLGVPDGFATLLEDLREYRPALIVDTAPGDLHHWKRYPLSRYPQLADFVAERYQRVAVVQGAVIYRRVAP